MTTNVGTLDRAVRLTGAAILFAFFFWATGPLRFVGLVGLVPLLTGSSGFCPLYTLLGINTCSRKA